MNSVAIVASFLACSRSIFIPSLAVAQQRILPEDLEEKKSCDNQKQNGYLMTNPQIAFGRK